MGCQRENDRKSYRFLFGTFFDRGVHFEKQRRYEENKHYGCVQSSRTVGIASCKLKLIIFIMFKVQVQLSRKHKYHNYSTKKEGLQPRNIKSQPQPLKTVYLYFNLHAVPQREGQLTLNSHNDLLHHQPPQSFIEFVNQDSAFFQHIYQSVKQLFS